MHITSISNIHMPTQQQSFLFCSIHCIEQHSQGKRMIFESLCVHKTVVSTSADVTFVRAFSSVLKGTLRLTWENTSRIQSMIFYWTTLPSHWSSRQELVFFWQAMKIEYWVKERERKRKAFRSNRFLLVKTTFDMSTALLLHQLLFNVIHLNVIRDKSKLLT